MVLVTVAPTLAPMIMDTSALVEIVPPVTMPTITHEVVDELCTREVARIRMNRAATGDWVAVSTVLENSPPKSLN